jgi:hypothetical protein
MRAYEFITEKKKTKKSKKHYGGYFFPGYGYYGGYSGDGGGDGGGGESMSEGVPQPGPSSGAPKQFGADAKIQTRQMTVKDIISSVPGVPYYNNVIDDWDAKDYSWGVTKKVIEYATYLKDHPESLAQLPPAIVLNGKFEDGAHRVSAIWLLQQRMDPKNPLWKNAKLNVQFVEQGVAEGSEQKYLWHGSRQKIPMLEPRQSVDTGGAAGSNQNAIYATSDPKVAIAVGGLTTPDSDTAMFPNDPQMVLFSGKIRKGENVYLHKLPFYSPDGKPQFVQGAHDREFYSIPGVKGIKPTEIKAVSVDKYLDLIRKATPADLELRKKNMKEQGVAEEQVNELYEPENSFPLNWYPSHDPSEAVARAYDRNRGYLDIKFTPIGISRGMDAVEVEFSRNDSYDMTGGGDANRVLGTVLQAFREYLKGYQPKILIFSAKGESRSKVYQNLIKRFAPTVGYKQFDISKLSPNTQAAIRSGANGEVMILRKMHQPN